MAYNQKNNPFKSRKDLSSASNNSKLVILQDTTWSGTVNLDGTVQVGEGVKLTVAKGTTINGGRIEVWGSLIVNGQSNSRINLNSVDIAIGSKYQQTPGTIDIQYATINEGSLFTNNGYGAYNLKDSILDSTSFRIFYPKADVSIARNIFKDMQPIQVLANNTSGSGAVTFEKSFSRDSRKKVLIYKFIIYHCIYNLITKKNLILKKNN